MSDGMSDARRAEREAKEAEDREDGDSRFNPKFREAIPHLSMALRQYKVTRASYFHINEWDEKSYPWKKGEILDSLQSQRDALIQELEALAKSLKEKL